MSSRVGFQPAEIETEGHIQIERKGGKSKHSGNIWTFGIFLQLWVDRNPRTPRGAGQCLVGCAQFENVIQKHRLHGGPLWGTNTPNFSAVDSASRGGINTGERKPNTNPREESTDLPPSPRARPHGGIFREGVGGNYQRDKSRPVAVCP